MAIKVSNTTVIDDSRNITNIGTLNVGTGGTVITTTGIGSVGIGTTNPTQKLDVDGGLRLRGALYDTSSLAGSSGQILKSTGSAIQWIDANTTNVGSANSIAITLDNTNLSRYLTFVSSTSNNNVVYADTELLYNPSTNTLGINTTAFTGTSNQNLQITGGAYVSGNLGIGTTTPISKLTVQGDVLVSGASTLGTVQISSGIVTATTGIVTYYGDGSRLIGISAGVSISTNTTNQNQYLTYVTGVTSSTLGISTAAYGVVFNPGAGNLGINTLPTARLSVASTTGDSILQVSDNVASGSMFRVNSSTGYTLMDIDGDGTVLFPTTGNVGIGTTITSPTFKLEVGGSTNITGNLSVGGTLTVGANNFGNSISVGGSITAATFHGNGAGLTNVPASVSISTNTTNQNQFLTYAVSTGSTATLGVTTSSLVFNPGAGNLGINTLPTARLSVASTTGDSLLQVADNVASGSMFRVNSSTGYPLFDVDGDGTVLFPTTGNVGIGTTITSPTYKLEVGGSARIYGSLVDSLGATGTSGQVLQSVGTGISWVTFSSGSVTVSDDTSTNATRYPIFEDVTSGNSTTINVSSTKLTFNPSTGTLSATVFTSLSDANKKTNIRPIENAIEITKKLEGVRFDWIDSGAPSIGVIAQEVEKVLPELVEDTDGVKSVSYGNIIGVLIEAIKEQQIRIEELERKIDA